MYTADYEMRGRHTGYMIKYEISRNKPGAPWTVIKRTGTEHERCTAGTAAVQYRRVPPLVSEGQFTTLKNLDRPKIIIIIPDKEMTMALRTMMK